LRVLRSGWLTTGKEAAAFEEEFSAFFADSSLISVSVSSATAGLHLALEALGVGRGDVVLVPTYTFAATAEAALYLGAEAVFIDSEEGRFNIDAQKLEETAKRLSEGKAAYLREDGTEWGPRGRPAAVIPVHFGGSLCDIEAVCRTARKYGLGVVEDCAHAFPSFIAGSPRRFAGTFGDIGVFSFYATKTLCTGEGGMAVTHNEEMASRMRTMRLHGIDRPVWNRYSDVRASWQYEVVAAGYKYNMPDLLAAIGRVQLRRAWELLEKRRSIAERYDAAFAGEGRGGYGVDGNALHLYPLRVKGGRRDEAAKRFSEAGIGVSVHFIPLHTMPLYKKRYGFCDTDFPCALSSFKQELSLPIWPDMSVEDVERVIQNTSI